MSTVKKIWDLSSALRRNLKNSRGKEHPLPPAQKSDLKGLRAMVVDDNETNRQVISTQLKAWAMIPTSYPRRPLGP